MDIEALKKLLAKSKEQEEPNMSMIPDGELTEQEASSIVNAEQDVEVTPAQEASTNVANEKAKSPNMKTKKELLVDEISTKTASPDRVPATQEVADPTQSKLQKTIQQYEDLVNKKEKDPNANNVMNWLTGAGKAANVLAKMKGKSPGKVDYWGDNQAKRTAEAKSTKLNNLQKLQDMYRKQIAIRGSDKISKLDQAKLDSRQKDRELKEKLASSKPKELSYAAKELAKANAKEIVEIKKENRKTKKEAEGTIKGIDEQIANVKKARKLLSKSSGNLVADTGPLDQFIAKGTDKGQALEQAMNSVSLDKMVKMFAGMSKAIDSDAERAFFQSAQPSMSKYPDVNKKILDDMIVNLESLKNKNKGLIGSIDQEGNKKEEVAPEQKTYNKDYSDNEVRRKTKDGKVAIFDKNTKEFLRYE